MVDPARTVFAHVTQRVEESFRSARRVLSFAEYLELLASAPARYARDASQYLRDAFEHFGSSEVRRPWGTFRRFHLFDQPWAPAARAGVPARFALVGHEEVQQEVFRALQNFVREGKPRRLLLLHGPNGSAKSTLVGCILDALEQYSQRDEGALYAFSWVFPTRTGRRGGLGFTGRHEPHRADSYAHCSDAELDAKLLSEIRDHPLFLVPPAQRREVLEQLQIEEPSDWLLRGELSHKNREVAEALLGSYHGDYREVLKHVRVERYFLSRRYRVGAVTLGPEVALDASERQITADRSLGALPASLSALNLYEARGELVDAAGGVLEFSDLLKRPLDAFKYLQLSVESGEINLPAQTVQLNCVMMGSANELHLAAFREHPEFASFRGRIELLRTPYLRSEALEQQIYDSLVAAHVQRHVAPHATRMAAVFAVLTRLRPPEPQGLSEPLWQLAKGLSVDEKLALYSHGEAPARCGHEEQKLLRGGVAALYAQGRGVADYEGRRGASPREMRTLLLDAAQSPRHACLSPLSVLEAIDGLLERRSDYEWLQEQPSAGGYCDPAHHRAVAEELLLELWEGELHDASGLVDASQYQELFERYVQHVSAWVKQERLRNPLTLEHEEPDAQMMAEVERLLGHGERGEASRHELIGQIAVWAISHPDEQLVPAQVFAAELQRMRDAVYASRLPAVARIAADLLRLLREEDGGLDPSRRERARAALLRLQKNGYCEHCAGEMVSTLLVRRFAHLNG